MSTYKNGPGNVPRLPDRVVDTLIDSAGVSRCAPGRTAITVRDQTSEVERLVHDTCEELLARIPASPVQGAASAPNHLAQVQARMSAGAASVCPNAAHMGEHACANRTQCWEPCGQLGKSAEHCRVAAASASGEAKGAAAGDRIVHHDFRTMLTNCIAAATPEKRKEFSDALLTAIQYEIGAAAERAQAAQPSGARKVVAESIANNPDAMIILTQGYPSEAVIRVVDAHAARQVAAALATPAPEQEAAPEVKPESWGECVWCGAPSDTGNRSCSAPDGDGHLFEKRRAAPVEQEAAQVGAVADYGMDERQLAARILTFMGRATTGSMEPGADPLADRLAEKLAEWGAPAAQEAEQPQGDVMRPFAALDSQHSAPAGALHDAVTRAVRDLPSGCAISIHIERGASWVEWSGVGGETKYIEGEGFLSDDVAEAIERATATNTNQPDLGAANTNKGGE